MSDLLASHQDLHAALDNARNIHHGTAQLNNLMTSLIEHRGELYKRENDNRFKRQFLRKLPGQLSDAIDAVASGEQHINNLEEQYNVLLDDPEMELEHKLRLGEKARAHVTRLRSTHQKQKDTLRQVSKLFFSLSKRHLKDIKRQ